MINDYLFQSDDKHLGMIFKKQFYPILYVNEANELVFTDSHFYADDYNTYLVHPEQSIGNDNLAHARFTIGKYHICFNFWLGRLDGFSVFYYDQYASPAFVVKYQRWHKPQTSNQNFKHWRGEFGANDMSLDQELMCYKIMNELVGLL